MESNKFAQTTVPTPTFVGRKRYVLVPATLVVAFLGYLAFIEPLVFSVEFDTTRILLVSMAAFFFMGLLVWADKENDKDKAWEEILSKHLENSRRNKLVSTQLADLLPDGSEELSATLNSPMASNFDSADPTGSQLNRWFSKGAFMLVHMGAYMIAMPIVQMVFYWLMGKFTESHLSVSIITQLIGGIALLPAVFIWVFYRKPILTSTSYRRIETASAKHRRYAFYKYHQQVLLDSGFTELCDVQFDSTICTFFGNSNRDLIAEVGVFNGRCYYGARSATEDGKMFHTRSGGFEPAALYNPDSVQIKICEGKPIEALLRNHAVTLTNHLLKSNTRVVALDDQLIDQLFLANRFRLHACKISQVKLNNQS